MGLVSWLIAIPFLTMLLILAIYIGLVILLPFYNGRD